MEWTGLPFVFALWAVRSDFAAKRPEAVASAITLFHTSRRKGYRNLQHIAAASSQRLGLGMPTMQRYYDRLRHNLSPHHISGLEAFFSRLHREEIIERPVTLSFFTPGKHRSS